MPPAIVHFERDADRQGIWREAMWIRTTEPVQQKYPEAEITATDIPDRRAPCHSKNIPEARREKIFDFPIPALATVRPKRDNFSSMQPQADVDRSRFAHFDQRRQLAACWYRTARPQATFHARLDHERNYANRAVQLIAGRLVFRAEANVARRSGTGDAGRRASRVPSLPSSAIYPHRQPAIPDGGRSELNK